MTNRSATAEIRKTATGYLAVTRVAGVTSRYPLPADRADAYAYARHFRTRGEAAGLTVTIRIDA